MDGNNIILQKNFHPFPDESKQIRGQLTLDQMKKPLMRSFGIVKKEGQWEPTGKLNGKGVFVLKISQGRVDGRNHYVFRFDVNEVQNQAECSELAKFSDVEWAKEFRDRGKIACNKANPCPHNNYECKQKRPKIVDPSEYWEVGYFILSQKTLLFNQYTYRYGGPDRKIEEVD